MHNGNVGAWHYTKRKLAAVLDDKWYIGVKGGTDSEWAFALFLHILANEGKVDPSASPPEGFGAKCLREAMKKTIAKINELVEASIPDYLTMNDIETRSLLNFAVTDGHSVVVTRYVSSRTDEAASLYYSSGTDWVDTGDGHFVMERRDKASDVVLVASEPLTFERHNWLAVSTNTIVTIENQTVSVVPVEDEYHNPDPEFQRSTGFAKDKGLMSKAPGGQPFNRSSLPTPEPECQVNRHQVNGSGDVNGKENAPDYWTGRPLSSPQPKKLKLQAPGA